jgi:hypothetical protein
VLSLVNGTLQDLGKEDMFEITRKKCGFKIKNINQGAKNNGQKIDKWCVIQEIQD